MDPRATESTVDKRQLLKAVAQTLAAALPESARAGYLAAQDARINRSYPAPSRDRMRAYLKSNIVR